MTSGVEQPGGSWLCPTEADRARALDIERRLKPVRAVTFVLLAIVLVVSVPWVGWGSLVPLAISAVAFAAIDRRLDRVAKPEYLIAASWLVTQLAIATAVVMTGGPESPGVVWLIIPAVTLPARFGGRGAVTGIAITAMLMVAVTAGVDPQAVADNPPLLLFRLAALAGVIVLTLALSSSDKHHRGEAVIDGLTGMLNRKAFDGRMDELVQQAAVTGRPVALVVADIDRFKKVNDEFGHGTGDEVLAEVAYRLRKELRAFDLAYRLGGEEFGVLLPGATANQAGAVAERLRGAVAEAPVAGIPVTVSLGVASSAGDELEPQALYEEADAALYRAKETGRNRVHLSAPSGDRGATGATWLARPSQPSHPAPVPPRRRSDRTRSR